MDIVTALLVAASVVGLIAVLRRRTHSAFHLPPRMAHIPLAPDEPRWDANRTR